MPVLLILFLMGPAQDHDAYIMKVREGYLDFNSHAHVDLVFRGFRWFENRSWKAVTEDDGLVKVSFTGTIPDDPATTNFHEVHQYSFKLAFKAIQLDPIYNLPKSKTQLSYTIHFKFDKDGYFQVVAGELGVKDKEDPWRYEPFTDRALLKVLEGVYSNENPYVSLIKGLPFK